MKRLILLLLACCPTPRQALAGSTASGQLSFTYGPTDAPLGCPVHLTLNNDTDQPVQWDPCGFTVVDSANQLVYAPTCVPAVTLQPGQVYIHTWPQTDQAGVQVAPGTYYFGDTSGIAIHVGNFETALSPLGAPVVGTARGFQLCSPQDPGARYVLLASAGSTPGISTCGGVIPLRRDRLLGLSRRSTGTFRAFSGTLDGNGLTTMPTLALPNNPSIAGLRIQLAFLVLDPSAPCPVQRISDPYEVWIR